MSIISLEAKAIPKRMAAHPQALLIVLRTIMFGYLFSSILIGVSLEKSLYASSMITIPSNFCSTSSMASRLMLLPVGLFGRPKIIKSAEKSYNDAAKKVEGKTPPNIFELQNKE